MIPLRDSSGSPLYLALYDELRQDHPQSAHDIVASYLDFQCSCMLPGFLLDHHGRALFRHTSFPREKVIGELYEIKDIRIFRILDKYYQFYPLDMEHSFYKRQRLRLLDPIEMTFAAVYESNYALDWSNIKVVYHGDWSRYVKDNIKAF